MTKWTKTRRDPGRTYLDEETLQRNRRMLERVRELVECGIEAEPGGGESGQSGQSGDHGGTTERGDYAVPRRCLFATARSIASLNFFSDSRNSSAFIFWAPVSIIALKRSRRA